MNYQYIHGVRMANLRTMHPMPTQPVMQVSGFALRAAKGEHSEDVCNGLVSENRHLLNQLSYALPLAERFCRMVLECESVPTGDGWFYWEHTSETDQDAGDILYFMVAHGHVTLHDSEPLAWRWADKPLAEPEPPPGSPTRTEGGRFVSGTGYGGERR